MNEVVSDATANNYRHKWWTPFEMRFTLIIIFGLFIIGCSNEKVLKVGLQPFDGFDKNLMDTISRTIKNTYDVDVCILHSRALPEEAFVNTKSPRYRADKLIRILKDEKPDTLDYIIGLTDKDISFTKRDEHGKVKEPESKYSDWGIFGLGYRPGVSCVISTYRLANPNKLKYRDRVKKVTLHELGHNFGLDHCESQSCLMRDAVETIKTIDLVGLQLCDKCNKVRKAR